MFLNIECLNLNDVGEAQGLASLASSNLNVGGVGGQGSVGLEASALNGSHEGRDVGEGRGKGVDGPAVVLSSTVPAHVDNVTIIGGLGDSNRVPERNGLPGELEGTVGLAVTDRVELARPDDVSITVVLLGLGVGTVAHEDVAGGSGGTEELDAALGLGLDGVRGVGQVVHQGTRHGGQVNLPGHTGGDTLGLALAVGVVEQTQDQGVVGFVVDAGIVLPGEADVTSEVTLAVVGTLRRKLVELMGVMVW